MDFKLKRFSFEDTYLPTNQRLIVVEKDYKIYLRDLESIPYPVTDHSTLML